MGSKPRSEDILGRTEMSALLFVIGIFFAVAGFLAIVMNAPVLAIAGFDAITSGLILFFGGLALIGIASWHGS